MLIQPLKNLSPLALLEPEIPGAIEPQPPAGKWGINLAAAQLNFPDKGLKVQIPVWSNKSLGDKVELLINNNVVDQTTITDPAELTERATLFVAPFRLQTGPSTLAYRVTRLNQAPEPFTPPLELDVKLDIPGGQDTDPDYGHSNLSMAFEPAEIVQDGVDKDSAKNGVDLLILGQPGSGKPYENIAVGDVITASWGGQLVLSAPVTQAQISNPVANPIKVHIDEQTILAAGDSGLEGLAVTFMVRDRVLNQSEDWCKETRIVVDTGNSRLDAPILQQADGNVLDLDTLGDEPLHLQVWAASADFQQNDVIVMSLKGTTLDGDPINVKVRQAIEKKPPVVVEVLLSNAAGRALAKTQGMFSYELERDGTLIQRSKGRFINIIGEPKRLAAPIAEDEQSGALDPDLPNTRIRIPYDPLITADNAIELKWFGTRPDNTTYDPELEWFFPSAEEANDPEGFIVTVEGKHLKTLEGGTLELWYTLLSDEDGTIIRRESLHATRLNVGEAQFELVKPIVLGEQEGVLEPKDLPGGVSKLTAPRPTATPTKANDVVTYTWLGEVTGKKEDSVTLNALSKDKDVNFTLNAAFVTEHIEPNRGKKVTASYRIWRAETNTTSYSNPLEFVVGAVLELKPPSVKEAEPDGQTLNPIKSKDTLTVVVPHYTGMLGTDQISVTWTGATGTSAGGSHTTAPVTVGTVGIKEIPLPNSVVAFNLGKTVTVIYTVIRGSTRMPSDPLTLNVQVIRDQDATLTIPTIDGAPGAELDVQALANGASTRIAKWPLIALGQKLWLRYFGTNTDGSTYTSQTYDATPVPSAGLPNGMYPNAPVAQLRSLKDGSPLRIEFKVTFDGSTDERQAVIFPSRLYTVQALVEMKPEITSVKGAPNGAEIPNGALTVETSVVLTGTASKGQKVDILDGTVSKGQPTADATTGIWTLTVSGLAVAAHSFTAKALYGAGTPSAARTFTVTAVVAPTISSVKGSPSGAEIPNGSLTIETSVVLTGTASKGQKVDVLDGTVSKGQATANATTGIWTLTVSGLAVAAHSFTAKALYGSGQTSVVRTLTVVATVVPTLTNVLDVRGNEVPEAGTTTSTTLKLVGAASKGLQVEIYDGSGSGAQPKGKATANATTGGWELTITVALGARRLNAKSLYHSADVYSNVRTLTVEADLIVDPSPLILDGLNFSIAGSGLNWVSTGNDPERTAGRKNVSGGTPPYRYLSSSTTIASVDSTGLVRSEGNGAATITVIDGAGNSKTFAVNVTNVKTILINHQSLYHAQGVEWINSVGGTSIISGAGWQAFSAAVLVKYAPVAGPNLFLHTGESSGVNVYHIAITPTPSIPGRWIYQSYAANGQRPTICIR